MKMKTRLRQCVMVAGGVAWAGIIGVLISSIPIATESKAPRVAEVVERHLAVADEQAAKGLKTQLVAVRELFSDARSFGTRAFADEALGWESKWKLTKATLFGGNEHSQFLQERFATHVFSEKRIEKTIKSAVAAYLRQLDSIESEMLVSLEADLATASPGEAPVAIDRHAIEVAMDKAVKDAVHAAAADTRGMIAGEVVSQILGNVLGVAAVELATSSGILSVGAASGSVTLGVGLVVGLIVDYLVGWIYQQYYDPAGELVKQLNNKLTDLETFILVGTSKSPGLEKRLQDYAARRAQARNMAIKAVVLP